MFVHFSNHTSSAWSSEQQIGGVDSRGKESSVRRKRLENVGRRAASLGAAAAIAIAALFLTGCASPFDTLDSFLSGRVGESSAAESQEETHDTILVLGNHANAVELTRASYPDAFERIEESLAESLVTDGEIKIIGVDGSPAVTSGVADEAEEKMRLYSNKTNQDFLFGTAEGIASDLVDEAVDEAKARAPEVDTLAALKVAGDECSKLDASDDVEVIVIDSGLATTSESALDFTRPSVMSGSAETLVTEIEQDSALPNLASVDDISWFGLGSSTAAPQADLSYQQVENLQAIYAAVLKSASYEGDADAVFVAWSPTTADAAADGLPEVSTVSYAVSIANDRVGFVPGKAEFIDPAATEEELSKVADELNGNPTQRVKLYGCTARYRSAASCRKLGYRRAEAVRDELVNSYGVAESQIKKVVGAGYESKYSSWDANNDGVYSDAEAQADRKIVIKSV